MVKKNAKKQNNEFLGIHYQGQKNCSGKNLEENSQKNPANQDVLSPAKLAAAV